MKKKFLSCVLLSILTIGGLGLSSCNSDNTGVILEERLWSKSTASDEFNNKDWEYKSGDSSTFPIGKDGTVLFRKKDDNITSKRISAKGLVNIDIQMSLNEGREYPAEIIQKGDLVFAVQLLDGSKNIICEHDLDEISEFPKSGNMDKIHVELDTEGKEANYIRFYLKQNYYKSMRQIPVGIGRVKAYIGEDDNKPLPDGVQDDYNPIFELTKYNSEIDENVRTSEGIALQDLRQTYHDLKTNGNQKILVIPVRFKDTADTFFDNYGGFTAMRGLIEKAFFGVPQEGKGWESLSSYYYQSSYGRLNLTGKVTPWYTFPYTVQEFYNLGNGTPSVYYLTDAAALWYKSNFDDFKEYDQDNNGYFDCVQFVYAQANCNSTKSGVCNSKNTNAKDLFWAFNWRRSGVKPMVNWPNIFNFTWMSYDFFINEINEQYTEVVDGKKVYYPDTHTIIHESGHALGLPDFYATNYDGSTPLCKVDMMDNNIGDHNAYSKWQLNWIKPLEQIVYNPEDDKTKRYEVTLRPFDQSGDCVIVPAYTSDQLQEGKNKGKLDSSLNEYLILEYFTPNGLNKNDSEISLEKVYPKVMNESGIKILHSDSRLGYISYNNSDNSYTFNDYLPVNADVSLLGNGESTGTSMIDYAHHNDAENQNYDNPKFRMLQAVLADEAQEKNILGKSGHTLSNADLFASETSKVYDFGKTNHKDYTFNNGFKNLYDITFTRNADNTITLVFEYKAN